MRKCSTFATKAHACEDQLDPCIVVELLDGVRKTVLRVFLEELFQTAPDVDTHAWPGVVVNLASKPPKLHFT